MGIETYSPTAADNTARWPEGMAPSEVNNAARADQADLRAWYNDSDFREYGNGQGDPTTTYLTSTSFRIAGADVTSAFVPTRKVRATGTGTGTIYGVIASRTFTAGNTDVTITWDAGSLSNEAIRVWLGNDPAAAPTPVPTVAMSAQLQPSSWVPESADRAFWNIFNDSFYYLEGMGVAASIASDTIWQLGFQLPVNIPAGTCKLQLTAIANATSGAAKVNPKWNVAGDGEAPGAVTLNAEGTTTVTWSSGDAKEFKVVKITLDASTISAGKFLIMRIHFETSGWTLAAVSTWLPCVIWE